MRLVNKRFHSAIGQSAIKLRPHTAINRAQLVHLSQRFRSAVSLNLRSCSLLDNESLRGFPSLFPRLEQLILSECSLLHSSGVAHLRGLSQLQFLSMENCPELKQLPGSLHGLGSLQHLSLYCCTNLRSLPEGISGLSSLRTLTLSFCSVLVVLPETLGALSLLQCLDLRYCR